jgi:hypothetical protein
MARQPLRLWLGDLARGRSAPRTRWAGGLAALFGAVAIGALLRASMLSAASFWTPMAFAALLLLPRLVYDVRNRGRTLAAELLGAAGPSALASAAARASGWQLSEALALGLVVAARAVPSVLYVRARLRLERGQRQGVAAVWVSHAAAIGAAGALAVAGLVPWLAFAAVVLLAARAVHGLSRFRRAARPQTVGRMEVAMGAAFVALVAAGFRLRL